MKRYLITIFLFCSSVSFSAEDVMNTVTQNSVTHNTAIISTNMGKPSDWGLKETEWKRYLALMEGSSGHYYPNLTPLEVLGMNADNIEDLNHFAELAVRAEHAKVEKELRFNTAFQEAAKKLYAEEPIIRPFDISAYSSISKQ